MRQGRTHFNTGTMAIAALQMFTGFLQHFRMNIPQE